MRYTIELNVGEISETAYVSIERGDGWSGFTMSAKPFATEASFGRETIKQRYNTFSLITPYDYDVKIKKTDETFFFTCDNPVQAVSWYKKQRATFGVGCAAVKVDSRRRVITIYVPSVATVEESL